MGCTAGLELDVFVNAQPKKGRRNNWEYKTYVKIRNTSLYT